MDWSAIALVFAGLLLPPADAELQRFPPREEVSAARQFNRAYHAHVHALRSLDRAHWCDYDSVIGETEALYAVWDCLDDAQNTGTELAHWQHLERLRTLLGPDDYDRGRLPPPAPFWRFLEID
jgi:hypothetical protein